MNAPHDPHDPLSQSLAEEAADLPARAARAARQRNAQRHRNRQRLTQAAVLVLLCMITWHLAPPPNAPIATVAKHSPAPKLSPEPDAPIAHPFAQTGEPSPVKNVTHASFPLPSGLDEEQTEFVKAVGDVPLLFVRDASGKVTRIHLFQR